MKELHTKRTASGRRQLNLKRRNGIKESIQDQEIDTTGNRHKSIFTVRERVMIKKFRNI